MYKYKNEEGTHPEAHSTEANKEDGESRGTIKMKCGMCSIKSGKLYPTLLTSQRRTRDVTIGFGMGGHYSTEKIQWIESNSDLTGKEKSEQDNVHNSFQEFSWKDSFSYINAEFITHRLSS